MSISFFTSQLPQEASSDASAVGWTGNVWQLLWADLCTIVRLLPTASHIVRPMYPVNKCDELYPTPDNLIAIFLHGILIIIQLGFFAFLFVLLCIPLPLPPLSICVAAIAGFFVVNHSICLLINGRKPTTLPSRDIHSRYHRQHTDEFWLYLNGVSVGRCWLQANVDRLSKVFGRSVLGVHNPTDGIIFDLVQCLVQRNFGYATSDIREAYEQLRPKLLDDKIKKVVFIAHSQGGIEASMMLDWFLSELPSDALQKLEVYTFGNAANHFNNPVRSEIYRQPPVAQRNGSALPPSVPEEHEDHPAVDTELTGPSRTATLSSRKSTAIRHIEHYTNKGDFVAQFGVLQFCQRGDTRFAGRVFMSDQAGGHLLNQHYLHHMFPLNNEGTAATEDNPFMEMPVGPEADLDEVRDDAITQAGILRRRESLEASVVNEDSEVFIANADSPITPVKKSLSTMNGTHKFKVKDFSRLWQYRNGGSPRT